MSVNPGDVNQLRRVIAQTVREHSTLFLVEGIILVVLGIVWGAIAACVIGALAYDIAYWLKGW